MPVNDVLAFISLQLGISERSGRCVPKIIGRYGKNAIRIEKTESQLPHHLKKIGVNEFVVYNKVSKKVSDKTNKTQVKND